jgi:hypothetical protein
VDRDQREGGNKSDSSAKRKPAGELGHLVLPNAAITNDE